MDGASTSDCMYSRFSSRKTDVVSMNSAILKCVDGRDW